MNWHGEKRTNETHVAPKDPEAKLFCKGKGQAAKLCYMGHTLMDHRHGLIVDVEVTEAGGYAERATALKQTKICRRQQNLKDRKIAVVVLGRQQWPQVCPHAQRVVEAINAATPGSYTEVEIP